MLPTTREIRDTKSDSTMILETEGDWQKVPEDLDNSSSSGYKLCEFNNNQESG
jgi:hypothetical protein